MADGRIKRNAPLVSLEEAQRLGLNRDGWKMLNAVLERMMNIVVEQTLLLIPDTLVTLQKFAIDTINMKNQWLTDNPDMTRQKEVVLAMIPAVEQDHPGWTYDKILEEVAKRVRNMPSDTVDRGEVEKPLALPNLGGFDT